MDGDAFFTDCSQSLSGLIHRMEKEDTSWLFSGFRLVINSGQVLWRNSEAAKKIVNDVNDMYFSDNGVKLWENGLLAAYLAGGGTNTAELREKYAIADECFIKKNEQCQHVRNGNKEMALQFVNETLRKQITYVPYGTINSYENTDNTKFIFHCAGQGNKNRCKSDFEEINNVDLNVCQ